MMRPRKTLNACAVGAVAICYLLSPPVFARLQSAGEQPPSIIPKYEAPRGGSGPGTSIPDDLWKGDRSTPGSIGGPTSNLSGPGNGSISQPPQTQSAQTQQANPQSQQPQPQSSTQSQSTLRLANHFPNTNQPQANNTNAINNGAGNSNQTSNFNPNASGNFANNNPNNGSKVISAGHTQAAPTTPSATSPQIDTAQSGNVAQASYDALSRSQSRTLLQPKSKTDDASKSKSSSSTLKMLISVVSSLAIVIGLFIGVAYLYRKSISSTLGKGLPKNVVQVLGRTTIAPRQQLVVVRFGSKLVLVSMLQGEARTISEITDPLEVDQLSGLCESSQSGSITNSFREILTQGVKA